MLDLDAIRKEFAEFLQTDPYACMDNALAHVVTKAYEKGIENGHAENLHVMPSFAERQA